MGFCKLGRRVVVYARVGVSVCVCACMCVVIVESLESGNTA